MFLELLAYMYTVAQILVPWLPPGPLSSQVLTTDQFLGKWYYVGVASWDDSDIASYQPVDSAVTELRKGPNNTVTMFAALREGDECNNRAWTYHIDPELDPLMKEGDENFGIAWDGKWIKCHSCLMLLKFHTEDSFLRIMLFAREEKFPDEVVETFKSKLESSAIIDNFIMAPRKKEFCQLQ